MTKTFAIGIPTLNRADLLIPSVLKYMDDFKGIKIHIVDNGNQNLKMLEGPNVIVHQQSKNIGVAASWNFLCDLIFKTNDNALIINDDVYLGYGTETIDSVLNDNYEYYQYSGYDNSTFIQSHHNFSVFLMTKGVYKKIGKFDEDFYPAYYEDSDYLYRLKLAGHQWMVLEELNPIDAKISQTYEKDPTLVNNAMASSRQRYIDKWGGLPLLETFETPFNKKYKHI
jgi:GT2 family glycosyltransferase